MVSHIEIHCDIKNVDTVSFALKGCVDTDEWCQFYVFNDGGCYDMDMVYRCPYSCWAMSDVYIPVSFYKPLLLL